MWRRNDLGDCKRGMADEAMPLYGFWQSRFMARPILILSW